MGGDHTAALGDGRDVNEGPVAEADADRTLLLDGVGGHDGLAQESVGLPSHVELLRGLGDPVLDLVHVHETSDETRGHDSDLLGVDVELRGHGPLHGLRILVPAAPGEGVRIPAVHHDGGQFGGVVFDHHLHRRRLDLVGGERLEGGRRDLRVQKSQVEGAVFNSAVHPGRLESLRGGDSTVYYLYHS